MQINSVNFGTGACPKPKNLNFKGAERITQAAKDALAKDALLKLDSLKSDMLRMTYEHAIDYRQAIYKEAQSKLDLLRKFISEV